MIFVDAIYDFLLRDGRTTLRDTHMPEKVRITMPPFEWGGRGESDSQILPPDKATQA